MSALLAPDAQSWSTDGLWAGGDIRVRPYDGAALLDWSDVASFWYADGVVSYGVPEDRLWCAPIEVTSKRVVSYRSVIDGASLPQSGSQFVVPIGALAEP